MVHDGCCFAVIIGATVAAIGCCSILEAESCFGQAGECQRTVENVPDDLDITDEFSFLQAATTFERLSAAHSGRRHPSPLSADGDPQPPSKVVPATPSEPSLLHALPYTSFASLMTQETQDSMHREADSTVSDASSTQSSTHSETAKPLPVSSKQQSTPRSSLLQLDQGEIMTRVFQTGQKYWEQSTYGSILLRVASVPAVLIFLVWMEIMNSKPKGNSNKFATLETLETLEKFAKPDEVESKAPKPADLETADALEEVAKLWQKMRGSLESATQVSGDSSSDETEEEALPCGPDTEPTGVGSCSAAEEPKHVASSLEGKWLLSKGDGDVDAFLRAVGIDEVERSLAQATCYGVGHKALEFRINGESNCIDIEESGASFARYKWSMGAGWQSYVGASGSMMVDPSWFTDGVSFTAHCVNANGQNGFITTFKCNSDDELLESVVAPSGPHAFFHYKRQSR